MLYRLFRCDLDLKPLNRAVRKVQHRHPVLRLPRKNGDFLYPGRNGLPAFCQIRRRLVLPLGGPKAK